MIAKCVAYFCAIVPFSVWGERILWVLWGVDIEGFSPTQRVENIEITLKLLHNEPVNKFIKATTTRAVA